MQVNAAPEYAAALREVFTKRMGEPVPHVETLDLQLITLDRGETLITPGMTHPYVYYILDGLIRIAVVTPEGTERITNIFEKDQLFGVPMLFRSRWLGVAGGRTKHVEDVLNQHREGDPPYLVSALAPTTALRMNFPQIDKLSAQHLVWANLVLHHIAVYAAMSEARVVEFLTRSPEERYVNFLRTRAHLLDVVPKRDIAWWLGITPESLSRIRSRHRQNAGATRNDQLPEPSGRGRRSPSRSNPRLP